MTCLSLIGKKALLLDMNGTFMFGEDRFGDSEDFSEYYFRIGGSLLSSEVNKIIRSIYEYLDLRYPDERYRHCFPSIESALSKVTSQEFSKNETSKIIETFAYHELGHISDDYAEALRKLERHFQLAAVIDIWSPKTLWLKYFKKAGVLDLFSAMSFSSDHGIVKPSPRPFELVLSQMGISNTQAIVVGDSLRRDLGGAKSAGIECILVGGAEHPQALKSYPTLLELCGDI